MRGPRPPPCAPTICALRSPRRLAAVVDAVVAAVAAAGPDPPPLVLLIGGVARTPLLAELLDAAGVGDVRVPSDRTPLP